MMGSGIAWFAKVFVRDAACARRAQHDEFDGIPRACVVLVYRGQVRRCPQPPLQVHTNIIYHAPQRLPADSDFERSLASCNYDLGDTLHVSKRHLVCGGIFQLPKRLFLVSRILCACSFCILVYMYLRMVACACALLASYNSWCVC